MEEVIKMIGTRIPRTVEQFEARILNKAFVKKIILLYMLLRRGRLIVSLFTVYLL